MAMELCINDKFSTDPSADEIARAIDAGVHPEGWYLVLDDEAGGSNIEVTARADGRYNATADDGEREGHPAHPLSPDQVKAILLKYRAGEPGWRDAFAWETKEAASEEENRPASVGSTPPPTWAVATVVGSIVLVVIAAVALQDRNNSLRAALPFGKSDYFFVWLIFLPMVVLVAVAVLAKMLEVRQAAGWSTAVGRIVKSTTAARHHRLAGDATTVRTMPAVEYEFSVGGRKVRGKRVSIGEDAGGANTAATLRRYTVGAAVTVYYDPADPKNSVLERDVPEGVGKGMAILVGLVVVVAALAYWLATGAPRIVEQRYPHANVPVVIVAASLGVLVLLFFLASWRMSRRAAGWPLVRGTVLSSGTEKIRKRHGIRSSHAPVVEYGYRVNDVDYVSRQIKLGVVLSASESHAAGVAARYPVGAVIDVHYDPANPSDAALENPTGLHWLLLVVAAGLFVVAARAVGAF
jgi:hypothetical protein